jgi:F1F0 ATPase subunit 2
MMPTLILELTTGVVAGLILGGLFFGALWLTVRRMPSASSPVLLTAGSYVIRLIGLGMGLFAVLRLGGTPSLLAALAGLLAARQIMIVRLASRARDIQPIDDPEGDRGGRTLRGEA